MPVVTVQVPAGSLNPDQKTDLISRITDALVDVQKAERIRRYVYVIVDETGRDGYGVGGAPLDATLAKAAQG